MPKKLVLDREISIYIEKPYDVITIPDGEIWRISLSGDVIINGISIKGAFKGMIPDGLFTGGCKIQMENGSSYSQKAVISGLAFKLQEV